jgi:hypothetical protein
MRGQGKPEAIEDFGRCPLTELVEWIKDVEYDCQVGVNLEVHEMETQF